MLDFGLRIVTLQRTDEHEDVHPRVGQVRDSTKKRHEELVKFSAAGFFGFAGTELRVADVTRKFCVYATWSKVISLVLVH